ncbi:MAG: ABC transporter substrate-binding protein [Acidimicrobiales bacterium]
MVLIAAAVLAAACTNDGGTRSATTRSSGSLTKGGILRLAVVEPGSLDPARARSVDELLLADQLFDTLVALDAKTLQPVPAVAARWGSSPDQTVWEFEIASGASFADGSAITGEDVKFTLERIATKGSGSSVADLLEPVRGFSAVNIDGSTGDLAGVTVDGPKVTVALDQPLAVFPLILANPAFGVVPRGTVEADPTAFVAHPLGSGPFRLNEVTSTKLTLGPSDGTEVLVDGIEVHLLPDRSAAYQQFADGKVDWAPVPPEQAEAAAAKYGTAGFRPYVAELFYGFNLKNPTFADVRFREAIARAVDRRAIAGAVYGGTVEPIESIIVPSFPGAQPQACGRCTHDPALAKVLVSQVFPDGKVPEVAIDFDDDATQLAVAKVIQANLQAVGIPVALGPRPLSEYQAFAVSGEQQLFRLGWVAAYASPDAFLAPLFVTGFPSNLTGLSSPEVDTAVRAARVEPDREARLARYQQVERLVLDQVPVVPIAQFRSLTVVSPRVRNLELTVMGTFDASAVWLARG